MYKKISSKKIALFFAGISVVVALIILCILFDQEPSNTLNLFSRTYISAKNKMYHTFVESGNDFGTYGKPSNCSLNQGLLSSFSTVLLIKVDNGNQHIISNLELVKMVNDRIQFINAKLRIHPCLYSRTGCEFSSSYVGAYSNSSYPNNENYGSYPYAESYASYPNSESYGYAESNSESVIHLPYMRSVRPPAIRGRNSDEVRYEALDINSEAIETLQIYFQYNELFYIRGYKDLDYKGQAMQLGQDPYFDRLIQGILIKAKDVSDLCYR